LSNYFLFEKTQTDPKLREAARKNLEFKGWDLAQMMKPDEDDPNYDVDAIENSDVDEGDEEAEEAAEEAAHSDAPVPESTSSTRTV
jgi:hypothetical protein